MPLFLGRHDGESTEGFRGATYEWDDGAIVIEPGLDGGLRLSVSSGSEREEHDVHFDPERFRAISSQSKLITIEDTRGRQRATAVIVVP